MAGALTERWRRRHWQLAAAAVVVIIVVCMSYVTRRRRRRPWPMLLISRPFPPKFSKPPKKSLSTRFFCSTKNIFRRAVCRRQSRFFRVLITPNPVFSTRKVCVQRHPERATRGRQIHGFCVGISTFQVTDRSLKLVVSCM